MTAKTALLKEAVSSPREVHAVAAGGSFGALTAFLWVTYSRTLALGFGLVFLSVVTGIRFTALLKRSDGSDALRYWVKKPTNLLRQLRKEGHYTVTAYTITAAAVYVALHVV